MSGGKAPRRRGATRRIETSFRRQRIQRRTGGHPARQRIYERPIDVQFAADAANGLRDRRPQDSAAYGPTRAQVLFAALFVALCVTVSVFAPKTAWAIASAIVAGGFSAGIGLRIAALTARPPRTTETERIPAHELPIYTIIVPLYDEANVVDELAAALLQLDYPRERLDIKIVLEADDFSTQRAVRDLALDDAFELLVVPPGRPRTKPRALNYALAFALGSFVVVYDAEDRPAPGQLRAALAAFAAGGRQLACVQAPLGWWNADETWLTRQFALEYASQFHVILPALASWDLPFPLGGTSNHFRRDALRAIDGWDAYNVTEDADIGFRLASQGWHLGVIAPPTDEEAPTTFKPWRLQRTRWIKGFMQTWGVRTRRPWALARSTGFRGVLALPLTLGLSIASSLVHGPLALWTAASLALASAGIAGPFASTPTLIFLLAGYGAAAAVMLLGLKRARLLRLAPHIVLTPLYWPLQTIAAIRAATELVHRPFHWEKTRHGRTRMEKPAR